MYTEVRRLNFTKVQHEWLWLYSFLEFSLALVCQIALIRFPTLLVHFNVTLFFCWKMRTSELQKGRAFSVKGYKVQVE